MYLVLKKKDLITRNKERKRGFNDLFDDRHHVAKMKKTFSVPDDDDEEEEEEEQKRETMMRKSLRDRFRFELANEIVEMSADDQLFEYDREEYKSIDREKPWRSYPLWR